MLLRKRICKNVFLGGLLFVAIVFVTIVPVFAAQGEGRNKNYIEQVSNDIKSLVDEEKNYIVETTKYEIKRGNNVIIRVSIKCTYYLLDGHSNNHEIDKLEVEAEAVGKEYLFTWRTASIDDENAYIELCYFDGDKNNVLLFELKLNEYTSDISCKKMEIKNDAYWPPWIEDKMIAINPKYHNTPYDIELVMSQTRLINNEGE